MNRSLLVLVVLVALTAAACGGADTGAAPPTTGATPTTASPPTTTTEPPAFPVTVTGGNGAVVIPRRPEAVVSLSPSATEVLFAIGAGDQVIAVDSLSDYPAQIPRSELSASQPNVEAIAELEPDLVVLFFDPGEVVDSLEALGIPTLIQFTASTLDEVYAQTAALGEATGNRQGAESVVSSMQASIDDIVGSLPARTDPVTYYHELDDTLYSVASSTFIGEVYALLGMVSIADAAEDLNFGYPQLSAEFILEADPDVILLADTVCCGQSAETLAERPGWDELTAVRQRTIVELDDSMASRPGPRIVDLMGDVALALVARSEAE